MRSYTQPHQEDGFTLEKYFSHIGLSGFTPDTASLETIKTIIRHHLTTFHYENTVLFKEGKKPISDRVIPSLEINELFKIMIKQNGGYCIQHLELLRAALIAIGFTVDRHLAKPILQLCSIPGEPDRSKTHELIIVHVNGKRYIAEVGMGNHCLRSPLELKEGEDAIDDDQYRLRRSGESWLLDTKRADSDWFCLYRFFNSPINEKELQDAHAYLYLSTKPIRIRDEIFFAAQTTLEKRKSITWFCEKGIGIFKSCKKDTTQVKSKELSNFEEAYSLAEKKFGFK